MCALSRSTHLLFVIGLTGLLAAGCAASSSSDSPEADHVDALRAAVPGVRVHHTGNRITRIYGKRLAVGSAAVTSAEAFLADHVELFGTRRADLRSRLSRSVSAPATSQPVLYDRDVGDFRFHLVAYDQYSHGLPVVGGEIRLLVAKRANWPLTLVASSLRDLEDYVPALDGAGDALADAVRQQAAQSPYRASASTTVGATLTWFSPLEAVVWADDAAGQPAVEAVRFIAHNRDPNVARPVLVRFVADAATGTILHHESLIHHDVSGTVTGVGSTGPTAAECTESASVPLAYATVQGGAESVATDASGEFVIVDSSGLDLTLSSAVDGTYFDVSSYNGNSNEVLEQLVAPGGVANFVHNEANTIDGRVLALVNAYVAANDIRDWLLTYNPAYPTIATQLGFDVIVNRDDFYCPGNAWYDSDSGSINFCSPGESYGDYFPNTAFGSIVYHEYGHHVVEMGGSGQSEYGEGMSDVVASLYQDSPDMAVGFFLNDCGNPLRSADNDCQYEPYNCSSCGWESHDCGNLLSGAVWSIRTELAVSEPEDALDIVSSLAINSVLLHTGSGISSSIAIDFLTLDDNDANLDNGSPHWLEICAGFEAHNIACPELINLLTVSLPGSVTEGDGVLVDQGTVAIVLTPDEDLEVTLTSSDTSELQLPATVTIAAGTNSVTFDATVVDDALLDGSQAVDIDASSPTAVPGSAAMTVHDNETAVLTLAIPANVSEGAGVLVAQGSIGVDVAVSEDVVIALTSSDPSEVLVPATVTVPAAATTVSFDVTIVDDDLYDDAQAVTVSAAVTGWTGDSAAITVADDEVRVLSVVAPASVVEGAGVLTNAGTVSIPGRLATPLVVTLQSADPTQVTVPAQVTIPALAIAVNFSIAVVDDDVVEGTGSSVITAQATDFTSDTATVEVRNDDVDHFVFAAIASPQQVAEAFTVTIDGVDGDGVVVPDYTKTVALSGAGDGGDHAVTPASTAAFSAGRWTGNMRVLAIDTNVVLTATDAATRTGSSLAFDVAEGPIDHFEIATVASPQLSRGAFDLTVVARDVHGFRAVGFTGTANLSTPMRHPSVVITEVNQGDDDYIEVENVTGAEVATPGWRLVISDSLTVAADVNPVTWQFPATLAAAEVIYASDNPADSYFGNAIVWRDGSPGWAMILDGDDEVVDFLAWGLPEESLGGLVLQVGEASVAIADAFTGDGLSVSGMGAIQRRGDVDHDNAQDFLRGGASKGVENSGLEVPFLTGVLELAPLSTTAFTSGEWSGEITLVGASDAVVITADDGAGHRGTSSAFELEIAAACAADPCANGAVCVPVDGGYECQCPTGYEGTDCDQDIDECATDADDCAAEATCTNTAGGFSCACNAGYSGDGKDCSVECGDGQVGPGEECDDGDANSNSVANACRTTCVAATCGDAVVDEGEACDEGATNGGDDASCGATCELVSDGGGGCGGCNSSTSSNGSGLIFLLCLAMLGRRRRRGARP